MDKLNLFIPIMKVDEEKRLVFGKVTEEAVDSSGEVFDYATSKPYFKEWTDYFEKATDGKSFGNLRAMHDAKKAIGSLPEVTLNDQEKAVEVVAKVVDDNEWQKVLEGVYTGFSQGGAYVKRWPDTNGAYRYTAKPSEISLVDYPCLKTATFQVLKADGIIEEREFVKREFSEKQREKDADKGKALPDGSFPIENKGDLKNAIKAYGRAKDKEAAKKHIIARAKALGATDMLPEDWTSSKKVESVEDLIKQYAGEEIGDAQRAVYALSDLFYLYQKEIEEDEPDQAAALKSVIDGLKTFISKEILETTTEDTMEMAQMIEALKKLAGELTDELVKAHSKETMSKIQGIHDHAADMGAACRKCDTGKTEETGDLAKVQGERDEAMKKITALEGDLKKVSDDRDTLKKRVEELEKKPEDPKAAKTVTKGEDNTTGNQEQKKIEKTGDPVKDEASALELLKVAMSEPRSITAIRR